MTIKNFDELIDSVGGLHKLCLALNLHVFTIQRWEKNGIPDKYVMPISAINNIPPQELRKLFTKIRAKRK